MRRTQPALAGFEDTERGGQARVSLSLEAGKGKETDFPLDSLERSAALATP